MERARENLPFFKRKVLSHYFRTLPPVAQAEDVITAAAGKLLRSVKLFDIYRGVGIPEGKKSMAFSLELRADDRTLTDTDSEGVVTKVLTALKEKLDAVLR